MAFTRRLQKKFKMMDFINNFLGIIVSVITLLGIGTTAYVIKRNNKTQKNSENSTNSNNDILNTEGSSHNININGNSNQIVLSNHKAAPQQMPPLNLKLSTQILFIDDEDVKVMKALKKSGWKHVKKKGDLADLDCLEIINADVIFVDINGVGDLGGYKNGGIGLAAAIKNKYPQKSVIIYSGSYKHDIFDKRIDLLDGRLPKNAEPIEFTNYIEKHAAKNN